MEHIGTAIFKCYYSIAQNLSPPITILVVVLPVLLPPLPQFHFISVQPLAPVASQRPVSEFLRERSELEVCHNKPYHVHL